MSGTRLVAVSFEFKQKIVGLLVYSSSKLVRRQPLSKSVGACETLSGTPVPMVPALPLKTAGGAHG
jgi:hypothetical protein